MQFCRFSYTSVLSRSYSTLTTPDNDQKITRRHPSRSAVYVFVHAIRKRSKKCLAQKVARFCSPGWIPMIQPPFLVARQYETGTKFCHLGQDGGDWLWGTKASVELLIHTYTACILENEIHTTENEMHTTDTPILVLCISLGSSFLFMDFISSLHAL